MRPALPAIAISFCAIDPRVSAGVQIACDRM
jgi:hypothetical protein